MKILTICTGNICRSPMAEGFLKRDLEGIAIDSAGLGALVGEPADPHAIQCMIDRGIDISAHRARQLEPEFLQGTEIVLTATRAQVGEVERLFPWTKGRVFRLGHWLGHDIDDPYRNGIDAFRLSCHTVERAIESWVPHLNTLVLPPVTSPPIAPSQD